MSILQGTTLLALAALLSAPAVAHAQAAVPTTATAQCGDDTWSSSRSQKGACSAHKGVKKWIGKKPRGATARCKDGEYWTAAAAQGACSGHGGVLTSYLKDKDSKKK